MQPLVLMWDNFGPLHEDRIRAVAATFGTQRQVTGLELCSRSDTYDWTSFDTTGFGRLTLFENRDLASLGKAELLRALIRTARKIGKGDWILCHWNEPAVFLFAIWLRLTGSRVWTMGCSKFDDKPRSAVKEAIKSLMLRPYHGGIASGRRSIDYFRFLGLPAEKLTGEYNTVNQERIRRLSGVCPAPDGTAFEDRGFLCVARLVPKKNLAMLLQGYAMYTTRDPQPRPLAICGSGPEEQALRAEADRLGISERVTFAGFVQTEAIASEMGRALALLLPSLEEQFGNVVPEAQAMGLPVILSENAGARDLLVRSGVTGFVIEPNNPEGLAFFLDLLARDSALWHRMVEATKQIAPMGDVAAFAEGVGRLTGDLPHA